MLTNQRPDPLSEDFIEFSRAIGDSKTPTETHLINPAGIYTNVGTPSIVVTEDKMAMILRDHEESVRKRDAWQTPIGFVVALFLALTTSELKPSITKTVGISSAYFNATLTVLLLVSFIWLVRSLYMRPSPTSIADVIQKMKGRS